MQSILTAAFLECTPYTNTATSTVWVTSYCVTLPAACPTSEWIATYTIETTCTGDRGHWTAPAIPPQFGVTTVVCDVCAHQTQTITCPNAAATDITVYGNGVTVTVLPTPGPGYTVPGVPVQTVTPCNGANCPAPAPPVCVGPGCPAPAPGSPTSITVVQTPTYVPGQPTNYVTVAGAPLSMKKSLGLMAGLALVAGQFLML